MARDVDARDVLDPDAMTRRGFRARVVGHWRRTGPNSWDKYRYRSEAGGEIEVFPGLKVKIERFGSMVRMRRQGRVERVEWISGDEMRGASPRELKVYFVEHYLAPFDEDVGKGVASVIASKLRE